MILSHFVEEVACLLGKLSCCLGFRSGSVGRVMRVVQNRIHHGWVFRLVGIGVVVIQLEWVGCR
jgi:hypothetical protein